MKRLISLAVSLLILAAIYWKIDFSGLLDVFAQCDGVWMTLALAMVVPQTLVTAWRLDLLMPRDHKLGLVESTRLILAAAVLNMVLPSKMGDIAKAYFMRERGHLSGSLALSLVVFEKGSDMLSLLLWCVFGLLLFPRKEPLFLVMTAAVLTGLVSGTLLLRSRRFAGLFFRVGAAISPGKLKGRLDGLGQAWDEMHHYFWNRRRKLLTVAVGSVFLWFLHLSQIWMFILALRASVPFIDSLALSPLALLAGLLPLTFAGIGTRDAALIYFYLPYFAAPTGAALGLLCTVRYLLPALLGLPFLNQYWGRIPEATQVDPPGLLPER